MPDITWRNEVVKFKMTSYLGLLPRGLRSCLLRQMMSGVVWADHGRQQTPLDDDYDAMKEGTERLMLDALIVYSKEPLRDPADIRRQLEVVRLEAFKVIRPRVWNSDNNSSELKFDLCNICCIAHKMTSYLSLMPRALRDAILGPAVTYAVWTEYEEIRNGYEVRYRETIREAEETIVQIGQLRIYGDAEDLSEYIAATEEAVAFVNKETMRYSSEIVELRRQFVKRQIQLTYYLSNS